MGRKTKLGGNLCDRAKERSQGENRYPPGAKVEVCMPNTRVIKGHVVRTRATEHYGIVVYVRLLDGREWSGTAERVRLST